jgi:hypothetical protein
MGGGISIWQLLIIVVPIALGILLKGIIKKFVIWAVDVVSAIGFIFFVLVGVGGGAAAGNAFGLGGVTGGIFGAFIGILLGTLIFAMLFLFLSINNALQEIKQKTS